MLFSAGPTTSTRSLRRDYGVGSWRRAVKPPPSSAIKCRGEDLGLVFLVSADQRRTLREGLDDRGHHKLSPQAPESSAR
jgi:hypothetical protein